MKTRDKTMKRTVCHRQAWVGCGRSGKEGKERARLGQPFCWSPKQINQGPLEHTNWITQMRLGGYTWQSCYKAATGVGRPRLQALSEINHPCWPLLAFLLSPHLSLCFFCACRSIQLFLPPLADCLCRSFEHCTFHNWDSFPIPFCSSFFSVLSKLRTFSHFVPEQPWLKLKQHDFVHISWGNRTWDIVFYICCNSLDLHPVLKKVFRTLRHDWRCTAILQKQTKNKLWSLNGAVFPVIYRSFIQ